MKKLTKFLAVFLLMLLISPNAWADAQFDEVYVEYTLNGEIKNATFKWNNFNGDFLNGETITSEAKITKVYMKYRKYNGNVCGGQLCYNYGGDWSYHGNGSWTFESGCWDWESGDKAGSQLKNENFNLLIADNKKASGSYTMYYNWQLWGALSSSSDCSHNWYMKQGNNADVNYQVSYKVAPPSVKSGTFSYQVTGSDIKSGTGAENDPYIIQYNGSVTFSISGNQNHSDANSNLQLVVWDGSKDHTAPSSNKTSLTLSNITCAKTGVWVKGMFRNKDDANLNGGTTQQQIWIQAEPAYTINIASNDNNKGTVSPSSVQAYQYYQASNTVTASNKTGYHFVDWTATSGITINSASATSTTLKASATGTVTANFAVNNYSITYDPLATAENKHFTYTTAPTSGTYNTNVAMEFTPDANYVIAEVTAYKTGDESTSVSVTHDGETNNYSFTQPAYDVTVKVVVSLSQVNVIYGVNGSNGTLTADPKPTAGKVNGGTNITFIADPADYYHLVGWYSDASCTQVIPDASASSLTYTISNISKDASVYVKFAENWTLNGTFNGSPINTPFGNWNNGVGYVDINNLNTSNTHTFTINFKDETQNITYGRSTAITPASCSELNFISGAGACTLTPSITGNYRISVNAETKKVTVTYPTMPVPGSITVTKERYLGDTKKESFIAIDPAYQVYTDEKIKLTIAEVAPPDGCTTYYQFGENAASSTERTYVIENPTTVENQSIEAKVFYRSLSGSADGAPQTETVNYQGVSLPALHLSASWNEKEESELSENPQVIIYYSADKYSGAATVTSSVDGVEDQNVFMTITDKSQDEKIYQMADNNPHRYDFEATATVNDRDFEATTSVSIYRLVKVTISDPNHLMTHYYAWIDGSKPIQYEKAWPGKEFEGKLGDAHIFFVKYPSYTHFVLNDGKAENATQTVDIQLPTESTCYTIGGKTDNKYTVNSGSCPPILYVGNIENVTIAQGESQLIAPDVDLDYGYNESQLEITFPNGLPSGFTAVQQGKKFLLTGTTQCAATTITAKYTLSNGVTSHEETRTFNATVTHPSSILIQVKYNDQDLGWGGADMHIRYWGKNIEKTIDLTWKGKEDGICQSYARIPLDEDNQISFLIHAWSLDGGNPWKQTVDVQNVSASGCYTILVEQDSESHKRKYTRVGDDCWAEYQVKINMASGEEYESNAVENLNDIVSFYAPGVNETGTKSGLVRIMRNGTQVAVVSADKFDKSGVYTAKIVDNGTVSLTEVALYTGDYYIRTDGVNPDNKTDAWDITKYVKERTMTNFSLYDGAKYNYYWTKNVKNIISLNVKGCVANDYNKNLTGDLTKSSYTDIDGNILGTIDSGTGVNLRFGYNPETNYFERAILRGSTASANYFLNVQGDNVFNDKACSTQELNEANYTSHPEYSVFNDVSDWVYEKLIYVKIDGSHPSASILLKSKDFYDQVMYQLGYTTDYLGHTTGIPAQRVVMGQGTSQGKYALRVIYDYKTNRLSATWEPEGQFDTEMKVDADILFVSEEGGDVKQVTFSNDNAKLTSLQSVMYIMELTNTYEPTSKAPDAQYWIALPFECKISDIFGIENYITLDDNRIALQGYWGIMRYRGDRRAEKGWFEEDTPEGFWEWMYPNESLVPGQGYVLYVEKKSLNWEAINVEEPCTDGEGCTDGKRTVSKKVKRFYFPSLVEGFTMSRTLDGAASTIEYPDQQCNKKGREAYDSNWKIIAPKSYDNIKVVEAGTYSTEGQTTWPKFIYEYNPSSREYNAVNGIGTYEEPFVYQSFHGYMAQYAGSIKWQQYSKTEPTSAPRFGTAQESEFKGGMLTIELVQNNEQLDRTFVNLSKNGTEGFDQNKDLTKIAESRSTISTITNNVEYAGNTLPLDIELVPLNIKVTANGTYDIALEKSLEGLEVRLYDAFEQTTTPLDMMPATVTLDKGEYKDRFFLQFVQKSPLTPTNFNGTIEQFNLPTDKTKKLLINDNIYLINAGRIYNVLGVGE